jgi:hypothetical protein
MTNATTYNIQFSALVPTNILVEAEEGISKEELISRVSTDDLRQAFLEATYRFEDLEFSWNHEPLKEDILVEDEDGNDVV